LKNHTQEDTRPHTKPHALKSRSFGFIDTVAEWMDSKFTLPGTRFKFGLDPILNLIPFAGNGITVLISGLLVLNMYKYGVSGKVIVKMIGNIALDALIGAIPILGNIFDFYYKANDRNVRLLKEHYEEGKHQGSGLGIIIVGIILILLVLAGIIYLSFLLLDAIF
jgi:hypothetical protein